MKTFPSLLPLCPNAHFHFITFREQNITNTLRYKKRTYKKRTYKKRTDP